MVNKMTNANQNNLKLGYILTTLGAIAWGFSGICGQYLMTKSKLDPAFIVNVRLISSGLILVLLSLFIDKKNSVKIFNNKKDILMLIIFGVFGILFCQYAYLNAINNTNAPTATVLQFLSSGIIVVYVCITSKRLPHVMEILSILIAIFGTFGLATHFSLSSLVISPAGLFWGFMAAISVAVYTLLPINLMQKYPKLSVIGFGMVFGGILMSFFVKPWAYPLSPDFMTVMSLIGMILIGTVIAFSAFLIGVSIVGPVLGGLIAGLEAVSSLFFAIILLNQQFTIHDLIGIGLILLSIIILSMKKD